MYTNREHRSSAGFVGREIKTNVDERYRCYNGSAAYEKDRPADVRHPLPVQSPDRRQSVSSKSPNDGFRTGRAVPVVVVSLTCARTVPKYHSYNIIYVSHREFITSNANTRSGISDFPRARRRQTSKRYTV